MTLVIKKTNPRRQKRARAVYSRMAPAKSQPARPKATEKPASVIDLIVIDSEHSRQALEVLRGFGANLSEHPSVDAVKKGFRQLARQYHPDFHQGDPKQTRAFQTLRANYEVLLRCPRKKSPTINCHSPKKYQSSN